MDVNKSANTVAHQSEVKIDDRIYNDSKGRPVGVAGKVNRVTNTVDHPKTIPASTPEDQRILDNMFNQLFTFAEKNVIKK